MKMIQIVAVVLPLICVFAMVVDMATVLETIGVILLPLSFLGSWCYYALCYTFLILVPIGVLIGPYAFEVFPESLQVQMQPAERERLRKGADSDGECTTAEKKFGRFLPNRMNVRVLKSGDWASRPMDMRLGRDGSNVFMNHFLNHFCHALCPFEIHCGLLAPPEGNEAAGFIVQETNHGIFTLLCALSVEKQFRGSGALLNCSYPTRFYLRFYTFLIMRFFPRWLSRALLGCLEAGFLALTSSAAMKASDWENEYVVGNKLVQEYLLKDRKVTKAKHTESERNWFDRLFNNKWLWAMHFLEEAEHCPSSVREILEQSSWWHRAIAVPVALLLFSLVFFVLTVVEGFIFGWRELCFPDAVAREEEEIDTTTSTYAMPNSTSKKHEPFGLSPELEKHRVLQWTWEDFGLPRALHHIWWTGVEYFVNTSILIARLSSCMFWHLLAPELSSVWKLLSRLGFCCPSETAMMWDPWRPSDKVYENLMRDTLTKLTPPYEHLFKFSHVWKPGKDLARYRVIGEKQEVFIYDRQRRISITGLGDQSLCRSYSVAESEENVGADDASRMLALNSVTWKVAAAELGRAGLSEEEIALYFRPDPSHFMRSLDCRLGTYPGPSKEQPAWKWQWLERSVSGAPTAVPDTSSDSETNSEVDAPLHHHDTSDQNLNLKQVEQNLNQVQQECELAWGFQMESDTALPRLAPVSITLEELAKHNSADDLWVAINGFVCDLTDWQEKHPGGAGFLRVHAGQDVSLQFSLLHQPGTIRRQLFQRFVVGKLADKY